MNMKWVIEVNFITSFKFETNMINGIKILKASFNQLQKFM